MDFCNGGRLASAIFNSRNSPRRADVKVHPPEFDTLTVHRPRSNETGHVGLVARARAYTRAPLKRV